MAIGKVSVFPVTFLSGSATSKEIDLGRGYERVIFDPTGAAGSCHFTASPTAGGTYRLVKYPVLSGMSAPQTCTVGSAVSGSLVEVSALKGLQFVKVVTDAAQADGNTNMKLYVSDV